MELTKLLLSDHPEKIWMVDETGIADYVTSGFPEVFERELERENSHNAGENETPGKCGCLVDGASKDALKECWTGLAALPADKSHRWAGFLRHMTPEQAVKILR